MTGCKRLRAVLLLKNGVASMGYPLFKLKSNLLEMAPGKGPTSKRSMVFIQFIGIIVVI